MAKKSKDKDSKGGEGAKKCTKYKTAAAASSAAGAITGLFTYGIGTAVGIAGAAAANAQYEKCMKSEAEKARKAEEKLVLENQRAAERAAMVQTSSPLIPSRRGNRRSKHQYFPEKRLTSLGVSQELISGVAVVLAVVVLYKLVNR